MPIIERLLCKYFRTDDGVSARTWRGPRYVLAALPSLEYVNDQTGGAITFNPAEASIPGFRPIVPRGLGRPTLPYPRQSTKRA